MALQTSFEPLTIEELPALAASRKAEGWRYVQMLCVNTEDGIDLVYSFMKDGVLQNYKIPGVKKGTPVPSVTEQFLAAFVFENEAHDLFGVDIQGIAIDFEGNFYALSQKEPMTIISPEQKAARDKAKKVAAAKAAKEKAAEQGAPADAGGVKAADAELEAKLADMDPEKAAKVRAAMEAKAKKAAAEQAAVKQAAADEKIAAMDPEKAAKVKAALEAKAKREAAAAEAAADGKDGE